MSKWIGIGIVVLALQTGSASAQYIGIFMDPEATSCAAEVGEAPWTDLHVIAVLEGRVTQLTGAQFQITGLPETWSPQNALWVPDPGSTISIGHPAFPTAPHMGTAGVNVAFSTCKNVSGEGRVPLGRVVLLGAPTPRNVHLRVTGFDLVPPDPDCPFLVDCGIFDKVCVGGGEIVLNGSSPQSCETAVEQSTWSRVKRLYE